MATVATLSRLAVGLARVGEAGAGNAALEQAMRLVHSPEAGRDRESLLSEIATTLAEMGRVDDALHLLEEVEDIRHHPPVLLAAAKVQAQAACHYHSVRARLGPLPRPAPGR